MTFAALMADLDASVFAHLSDDTEAVWSRLPEFSVTVAAMLTRAEQPGQRHGVVTLDTVQVARLSAAEVQAKRPGDGPLSGDQLTINGAGFVISGSPWLDGEANGRDWLCPVATT
jgi:hypothetical protein